MADEQLRLVASVKDEFSGPLRNLKGQLAGVRPPPAMKEMSSGLKEWQQQMRATRTELQTALSPALSSFGIATMGVGAGFAAIGAGVRNFAGGIQSMRLMGREVGLTTDNLRAFSALGARFGVSAETMQSGIRSFAGTMEDVRKRWGDAYAGLRAMNLGKLAEELVSAPDMRSAIERVFNGLGDISNPETRRRVLALLGLPQEWSAIAVELKGKVRQTVDEIAKDQGSISAAAEEAANKFEMNYARFQTSLENLRVQGFTPLLPVANEFVETLAKGASSPQFVKQLNDFLATTKQEFEGIKAAWAWMTEKTSVVPLTKDDEIAKRQSAIGKLQRQVRSNEEVGLDAQYPEAQRDLKREIERLTGEIKRLREEGATAQKSASGGVGMGGGGLIQNASFGGGAMPGFRFGFGGGFNGAGGGAGGGSGSDLGSGVRTPMAKGEAAANAQKAYTFWRRAGLSHEAASGILASMDVESGFNPKARGDGRAAHGLFQHHGDRRADIMRGTGIDMSSAGVAEQLEGTLWEMTQGGDRGARAAWRALQRKGISAREAGAAFVRLFERPARNEEGSRGALAEGWSRRMQSADPPGKTPGSDQADGGSHSERMLRRAISTGFGSAAPKIDNTGTVNVHLTGGLEKLPARVTMDGLFNDVKVSRGSQVESL